MGWMIYSGIFVGLSILGSGIRIVRPTHNMLVETLGKWTSTRNEGFQWIFPIIQQGLYVNVTEQMVDVPEQTVQTADKLNTKVDAMVYYQIRNAKASQYNVDDHQRQLTSLARTTLRAVMGNMTLTECIQKRDQINKEVEKVLEKETNSYGVTVLRVEVQRIEPPRDVQDAMNEVVKAEQEKIAAKDFANAVETKADGTKRAEIKEAEGRRQGSILKAEGEKEASVLVAEGQAKAFKLVSESFKGGAKQLKELEVTENALKGNSKIILGQGGKDILKLLNVDK